MKQGFVYLAAIVDWFSRRVLAWRLSITLEVDFCIAALKEALFRYGKPDIFNTDQGSQFTPIAFTQVLKEAGIKISMGEAPSAIGSSEQAEPRERGATMSLSSVCGALSNMRKSICMPTKMCRKRGRVSVNI